MKSQHTVKSVYILLIGLIICQGVLAQLVYDYKRNADAYYQKGDYYSAAIYYEKYLQQYKKQKAASAEPYTVQSRTGAAKKNKSIQLTPEQVAFRIAECYRKLNNYKQAEPWYAEAAKDSKADTTGGLWYGTALKANGKFSEAEQKFTQALAALKDEAMIKLAEKELASVQYIQQQQNRKDAALFTMQPMAVNSGNADYAAALLNNKIVFTSTRADSSLYAKGKQSPFVNNLYQSDKNAAQVSKLNVPRQDGFEQGVASFTPDGKAMFLTRWSKPNGKKIAAIYVSKWQDTAWSVPEALGNEVNVSGYSAQEPSVTPDGKYLLFASDKPGGYGKFDLYAAPLSGVRVSKAVNLGKTINTEDDDQSPYYHAPTQSLVFASNGRLGMGGFDLYYAKGSYVNNEWQTPVNPGKPVNSIKDEMYFLNTGSERLFEDVIISTDRNSECCLQLFSLQKQYRFFVKGMVTDCKTGAALPTANVTLSAGSDITKSLTTEADGSYLFELKEFAPLQMNVTKAEYNNAGLTVASLTNADADTLYNTVICLVPIEKPEPPKQLKAFFDFAKYDLFPETGVLLDTLAALLQREGKLGLELYGYTDKKGTEKYNLDLSKKRAEACRDYLVQKGIEAGRLKVIPKGECCQEADEQNADGSDNADGRKLNRRVEFKIILLHL